MGWYRQLKLAMPVLEKRPTVRTPTGDEVPMPYTDIGHQNWKRYDYRNDDNEPFAPFYEGKIIVWYIDNTFTLHQILQTEEDDWQSHDGYFPDADWDAFVCSGRYEEPADGDERRCSVSWGPKFKEPNNFVTNKVTRMLDRAFNNPAIIQF